jgi:predicted pyridoxine 5'-phosphate oxidase superfamily flavin-nucleotide-binding protein
VSLTADQIKARSALVEDFRAHIAAAMWEMIEHADLVLLSSDDGTPYGETFEGRPGGSSLDRMVNECTERAVAHLRNWL